MLLSRFLLRKAALGWSFNSLRTFCSQTPPEEEKLLSRIQAEKHFTEVIKLVDTRRSELNHQIITAFAQRAHRTLSNKEKNENLARKVIQTLRSLTTDERKIQELTCFLTLLRNMKFTGYHLKEMAAIRNLIIAKCMESIKGLKLQNKKINTILALYYELAFFKKMAEVKVVAEIIYQIAEADSKGKQAQFTDKDISFFFSCLTLRVDMNKSEVLTRSLLLKRINSEVSELSGEEQAMVLIHLSKTDVIDLNHEDIVIVRQLVLRVEKSISQLGEESIMSLARCSNHCKLPGFFRISQEIYRQIFFEIKKTGITEFGYQKVLHIIGLLSDKISFHKANEVEQIKLFSLLEKFAKECGMSSSKSRQFCQLVHPLVKNRFFSDEQLDKVLQIMQSNDLYFSIHFIYDVVIKGKISPSIKDLLIKFNHHQISDEYLVKVGVAVCKSKARFPQLEQPFKVLKQRMAHELRSPASFIEFFNKFRFRKYSVKLFHFHQCFGDLFNALPNPFLSDQKNPQYAEVYLLYISQGPKTIQALKLAQEVPNGILCKLIEIETYSEGLIVEENAFLVRIILEKLPSMLAKREAEHINLVISFLYKYNRLMVLGILESSTEDRLMNILCQLISSLDVLAEVNQVGSLFAVIDRYLSRSFKNYRIEHSYRTLLRHLLENLRLLIKHQAKILSSVIREGLRLDMVNKSMCDCLDLQSIRLNFIEKQRLAYIKDPMHLAEITRIEPAALQLICANHNLEETAVEGEKYILQILQKIQNRLVLCHLLKLFNLRRSPASKRIHSELLNNLIGKLSSFEGLDLIGVFRNALDKNFYRIKQYRILCEKAIQQFSSNIPNYSIYSHIELIKFIMSQKKIYPQTYYTDLVDYCFTKHVSEAAVNLLLMRIVGSDFEAGEREAKHVFNILSKNAHNAVFYFLMVEEKLSASERSTFVKELSSKYNKVQPPGGKFLISKLQYLYIKKRYPSETAELTLTQFSGETFAFRLKDSDILSDIEKMASSKIVELGLLGQNQPIYQIKDFIFYFTSSKKYGHTNEHNFNNRAISYVFQLKPKVVHVFHGNNNEIYEQMHDSCFGLFSEEEYRKITAAFSDEARRAKRTKN